MSNSIAKLKKLNWSYGEEQLFDQLSVEFEQNSFTTIVGPNGSGKTTLLRHLLRLLPAKSKSVEIAGKDINSYSQRDLAQQISYVPQKSSPDYEFTLFDYVAMGRYSHLKRFVSMSLEDRSEIEHSLELTETAHLRERKIGELSGGEFQRMLIARALAQKSQIIALDEPVSHLDVRNQRDILHLLRQLVDAKAVSVITVLHDLNAALAFSDRLIMMENGRIAATGLPVEVLTPERIQTVYNVEVHTFINPETGQKALLPFWL